MKPRAGGAATAPHTRCRVHLTRAQLSAVECALIDEEDEPVFCATYGGYALTFLPSEAPALAAEITELANSEDALAEHTDDPAVARGARGARAALTNLARAVLRATP